VGIWDRCADGSLTGVLSRDEIDHLRGYADGLVQLAEYGLASCSWVEGRLDGSGGWFPGASVADTRIMAIVRDRLHEDSADWEVAWHAADCLLNVLDTTECVRATLPESGGIVRLTDLNDVRAWYRLLSDVISAIGPYAQGKSAEIGRQGLWTAEWLTSLRNPLLAHAEMQHAH